MTNWHRTSLLQLLKLCDLSAIATPGGDTCFTILEMRVKVRNVVFMAGYIGFCHLVLHGFGLYRSYRLSPTSREWRDLAAAVLVATIPIWATADVLHLAFMTT